MAHEDIKPWNWATLPFRSKPVEIVSYPCPVDLTTFVRLTPGDPTSAVHVKTKHLAAFSPDRHELFYMPKRYYSDNPTVFSFIG